MVDIINTALVRAMLALSGVKARLAEERGQDLLEYALLGGLIAMAIVAVALTMTNALSAMITNIGYCIDFNNGTSCNPGW